MKRVFVFAFLLILCCLGTVSAQDSLQDVSPAIEILRNQTKLRKNALCESKMEFSRKEFQELLGKEASHLTILELPKGGKLQYEGLELEAGQTIALTQADQLSFLPTSREDLVTSFRFKDHEKTNACAIECVMVFSTEEVPEAPSQTLTTYRDCMAQIKLADKTQTEEGWSVHICNAPAKGLLSTDASGTVVYAPQTTYEGVDGFTYQLIHTDGRCTPKAEVRIQVGSPYGDLFFSNLKKSPLHAMAVDFCKFTEYEAAKDENGYYNFDTEAIIPTQDLKKIVQTLLQNQGIDQQVFENQEDYEAMAEQILHTFINEKTDNYTYVDAIQIVNYTLNQTVFK